MNKIDKWEAVLQSELLSIDNVTTNVMVVHPMLNIDDIYEIIITYGYEYRTNIGSLINSLYMSLPNTFKISVFDIDYSVIDKIALLMKNEHIPIFQVWTLKIGNKDDVSLNISHCLENMPTYYAPEVTCFLRSNSSVSSTHLVAIYKNGSIPPTNLVKMHGIDTSKFHIDVGFFINNDFKTKVGECISIRDYLLAQVNTMRDIYKATGQR